MTPEQLREILRKPEGLKLDFKREYKISDNSPGGTDKQQWINFKQGQWDEFIRDVIALANGNIGTAGQDGLLIIGADDKVGSDGNRMLYDTSDLTLNPQRILAAVNSACDPPLPDIIVEQLNIDGKTVNIVIIPASPYLHETTRQLGTTKGEFDETGTLRHFAIDKTYTSRTAFVRRGESVFPATDDERRAISIEKVSALQNRIEHVELDRKLFLEMRAILTSDDVKFLCENDYGGSFILERHTSLYKLIHFCERPENEFLDSEMEKMRITLFETTTQFTRALGKHTAPERILGDKTVSRIPRVEESGMMDWMRKQTKSKKAFDKLLQEKRREIFEIQQELNNLAQQVCDTYKEFIRLGRKRLAV